MEKSPKISVIIPVYNCEKYVGEAIESVLNQAYKNIHIVLVDDGSLDSSPEICDRYVARYDCVHVIHQKNAGVSSARNAGIEYVLANSADTDYIAFLDADDKWYPDFLNVEQDPILAQGAELLGFQSCNCNNAITRRNRPGKLEEGEFQGGAINVWKHSSQHFASMLYAKSLICKYDIRFDDRLKYSEDVIFRMQCIYLAESMSLINRLMYLYRHSATSAVHSRKFGISYFEPIIDGWIASDMAMDEYKNEFRSALWEGRAMAAVCIVDMAEEHYRHFGTKHELDRLFQRKPEYLDLITGHFACNRPDSGLRWQEMNAHPVKFRVKCYIRGVALAVTQKAYRVLMKIPVLASYIEKKRYPISL